MAAVIVSLTLAVAVPVPTTRFSKLPPETPVIVRGQAGGVAVDVLAVARAIVSVPVVAPSAIVMSPWSVWMVVTPCEAFDSVAVNT